MIHGLYERVAKEQAATDAGRVYEEHGKLRQRFRHADLCPNFRRGERYFDAWLRRVVEGAEVLDLGCNEGQSTLRYSRMGARRLVGVDISPVAIEKAKALGSFADFKVCDAHRTGFPDNAFDAVVGSAILHHLDYETAVREIHRVLKPGGYAIFREPLRGNPAAKLIRLLTPKARTADELPLSRQQIRWTDRLFCESHHGFFGLSSTGIALLTSVLWPSGRADNLVLRAADQLDNALAHTPMRYWMRYAALVWRK